MLVPILTARQRNIQLTQRQIVIGLVEERRGNSPRISVSEAKPILHVQPTLIRLNTLFYPFGSGKVLTFMDSGASDTMFVS